MHISSKFYPDNCTGTEMKKGTEKGLKTEKGTGTVWNVRKRKNYINLIKNKPL